MTEQNQNAAPGPPRPVRRRRSRATKSALVTAILAFAGTLVLVYPMAATWVTAMQQAQVVDDYAESMETIGPADRLDVLRQADEYNTRLEGGASVLPDQRIPQAESVEPTAGYDDQLVADENGLMARLRIPSINLDLPIRHGTSESVLQAGVGHLEGTALPVGGNGTHSVLTSHRGLASAELFTRLNEVTIGDRFTIDVFGKTLSYQVTTVRVVDPSATETLYPTAGRDLVTLVTCTPLGINSHRILVTAERVLPTPPADVADAGRRAAPPGPPWWTAILIVTSSLLVIYVRRSARN